MNASKPIIAAPMQFFFSGIKSDVEYRLMLNNGASRLLVDPFDYPLVADFPGPLALDSGAYRAYKNGYEMTPNVIAGFLEPLDLSRFAFVTTCDVMGNPQKSLENWRTLNVAYGIHTMPVWQWGAPLDHLREYMDGSPLVGLGGMVPLLRDVDKHEMPEKADRTAYEAKREAVLEQVGEIVARYPGRFHFFGLCWMRAIAQLAPYLYSADSSFWLEGARKRYAVFKHAKTGKLTHAPQRVIAAYKSLSREELLASNIREIEAFFNLPVEMTLVE